MSKEIEYVICKMRGYSDAKDLIDEYGWCDDCNEAEKKGELYG